MHQTLVTNRDPEAVLVRFSTMMSRSQAAVLRQALDGLDCNTRGNPRRKHHGSSKTVRLTPNSSSDVSVIVADVILGCCSGD